MVFSAKMLLNTGTPSVGQPTAPTEVGLQLGEEYGRKPTRLTCVPVPGAPVIVQPAGALGFLYGQGIFGPVPAGLLMYGMSKVWPAGTVNE